MADYEGHLDYEGQRVPISGGCTYEYFKLVSPYGLFSRPLPHALKVPMDRFSYQILDIDNEIQLMLTKVGIAGETLLEAAWVRRMRLPKAKFRPLVSISLYSLTIAITLTPHLQGEKYRTSKLRARYGSFWDLLRVNSQRMLLGKIPCQKSVKRLSQPPSAFGSDSNVVRQEFSGFISS